MQKCCSFPRSAWERNEDAPRPVSMQSVETSQDTFCSMSDFFQRRFVAS